MRPAHAAVASLFVLIAGCLHPSEPLRENTASTAINATSVPRAAMEARQKIPGLSLTATSPAHAAISGNEIPLVLSLTNHGHIPDTLVFFYVCRLYFNVYDQRGNLVYDGNGCVTLSSGPNPWTLILQPGETFQREQTWLATTYDVDTRAYVPAPPGVYRIRAYLAPHLGGQLDLAPPFVLRLLPSG